MRGLAVLSCAFMVAFGAGCGGSRAESASTTKTTPPPGTQTTSQSTATAPATTATTTSTAAQTAAPPTATGTPPTAPETTTNPGAPASGGAPPSDIRLPATFAIARSGSLNPPVITAPAHVPVDLTLVSSDGPHRVLIRTPNPHTLAIPAHGHASVLLTGLKLGRYPVEVDGTARGALVIGGAPGP